jgi:hypothetical protein
MPISLSSPLSTPSPIVDQVIERKRRLIESQEKLKWSLINFLAAAFFFLEAENHFVIRSTSTW